MEKIKSSPCTVTIPPSKTCTTGVRSKPLWVSVIEDDPTAWVLREGTVCNDMSRVIAEGTNSVQTEVGGVAKTVAKRTVVSMTTVLGMTRGIVDSKMGVVLTYRRMPKLSS